MVFAITWRSAVSRRHSGRGSVGRARAAVRKDYDCSDYDDDVMRGRRGGMMSCGAGPMGGGG